MITLKGIDPHMIAKQNKSFAARLAEIRKMATVF
jgi:hypothetical protein